MNQYFIIDAPEEYHAEIRAKISELIWKDKLGVRQIITTTNPDNVTTYIQGDRIPYSGDWKVTAVATPGINYSERTVQSQMGDCGWDLIRGVPYDSNDLDYDSFGPEEGDLEEDGDYGYDDEVWAG